VAYIYTFKVWFILAQFVKSSLKKKRKNKNSLAISWQKYCSAQVLRLGQVIWLDREAEDAYECSELSGPSKYNPIQIMPYKV
jgi:hypothetical protein